MRPLPQVPEGPNDGEGQIWAETLRQLEICSINHYKIKNSLFEIRYLKLLIENFLTEFPN